MGRRRRRYWSEDEKRRIVAEARSSGVSVSMVARRHDVNANLVFKWLRDRRYGQPAAEAMSFLPVEIAGDGAAPVGEVLARDAPVEIELGCGTRLRVDARIDEVLLVRMIRAVRRA